MENSLKKNIDVCHGIIVNNRPTYHHKIDDIRKPLAAINRDLDLAPHEEFVSSDYKSKLKDIIKFVLENSRNKPDQLSDALDICCNLTRYNPISTNDQEQLIIAIHMAYGKLGQGTRDERKAPTKKMTEIVCNLMLKKGCNENILSNQRSATTVLTICSGGFRTVPEAVECSNLVKYVLMYWPSQFQGIGLIPGQKKATTSIVVSGNGGDWPRQKLKQFIRLALDNYIKLTKRQVEAKRGLRFAITRALSLDHQLVWCVLNEMGIDADQFVAAHLNGWFEEIGADRLITIENTILSCHLLLKMISLHESVRPTLYEHYVEHIIPKTVLLFGQLANYHRSFFTPNRGSNRFEPCDRMIGQMLYKFVMVESDDPEWQAKLMETVTPELGRELVYTLVDACTKRVFLVEGRESRMTSMEPPGEHDETFWGQYHDEAFRVMDGQQRASFGFHLKSDSTFTKLGQEQTVAN